MTAPLLSFTYFHDGGASYDSISGRTRSGLGHPIMKAKASACTIYVTRDEMTRLVSVLEASNLFQLPNPPTANELPYCDLSAPTSESIGIQWKGRKRVMSSDFCNPVSVNLEVWVAFADVANEKIAQCR